MPMVLDQGVGAGVGPAVPEQSIAANPWLEDGLLGKVSVLPRLGSAHCARPGPLMINCGATAVWLLIEVFLLPNAKTI